jgi:hypothetical protein
MRFGVGVFEGGFVLRAVAITAVGFPSSLRERKDKKTTTGTESMGEPNLTQIWYSHTCSLALKLYVSFTFNRVCHGQRKKYQSSGRIS